MSQQTIPRSDIAQMAQNEVSSGTCDPFYIRMVRMTFLSIGVGIALKNRGKTVVYAP